jgi:hypothetical protein
MLINLLENSKTLKVIEFAVGISSNLDIEERAAFDAISEAREFSPKLQDFQYDRDQRTVALTNGQPEPLDRFAVFLVNLRSLAVNWGPNADVEDSVIQRIICALGTRLAPQGAQIDQITASYNIEHEWAGNHYQLFANAVYQQSKAFGLFSPKAFAGDIRIRGYLNPSIAADVDLVSRVPLPRAMSGRFGAKDSFRLGLRVGQVADFGRTVVYETLIKNLSEIANGFARAKFQPLIVESIEAELSSMELESK